MQITEHIHALKIPFQIEFSAGVKLDRFVYVFLIYGKDICIIDSGVANSRQPIFDYIRKTGRQPDDISMVILTHSHPDHIGSARLIKAATGCLVAAHPLEKSWIEDIERQAKERPIPNFRSFVNGAVKVDRLIENGAILDFGDGLKLEAFHTPGHSKGSLSLWLKSEGALFCGDAIIPSGAIPIYEDALSTVLSIKKIRQIQGINHLLSAWDDPREGASVYKAMDDSMEYMQRIHECVRKNHQAETSLEPMELCKRVAAEFGLPEAAANPLVARSFQSNVRLSSITSLINGI
ncbi:MAG TPA: MBL fold metallo-hydrolase [Candidatus Sumerlaeota bacterium]|nr:MAG: putative diflavin flavoprotein A 3 [candidate division BRC1 bacterium ADurb.Bin183]HOE64640.1 MBL fold metallo-hydrolase [Candidatus Sumerlaeota bacterium]HRR32027.1 MBL fold metallo-hydrolase [Candidatus Sumerlaeia bacterium]HON51005.1 MBL fold metallo-hydrolase [Candidatus Sumerlaeota bacterium]HOR63755.1 MBL fold metallo-hydrolase [Candidatus Sumerlaeota bacterium]